MEEEGMVVDSASLVACSICLDDVLNNGERSRAILQCGHQFHLDCIGSMFNSKAGVMQCPNCRKTEQGQWLFANAPHSSYPEFNIVDWPHDDDLYDVTYSEMPFGAHWCPFRGLAPVSSLFEDRESSATAFHEIQSGAVFAAENTAASSLAGPCPYLTIFQPVLSSASANSNERGNALTFNNQWSGLTRPNDISASHASILSAMGNPLYPSWDSLSSSLSATSHHTGGTDGGSAPSEAIRTTGDDSAGLPRSGSVVHPIFLDHGSGARAGNPMPSTVPPYPGVNSRAHDRVEALHAQQQLQIHPHVPVLISTVRRPSGPRGVSPVGPPISSDHGGNFYMLPTSGSSGRNVQAAVNPAHNQFYAWERDRFAPFPLVPVERELNWWQPQMPPTVQVAAGNNSSDSMTFSFGYSHSSELGRTPSQGGPRPHPPPGQMQYPFI